MSRDTQVFVHDHAAAFVDWHADRFSDERSDVARGPNLETAGNKFTAHFEAGLRQVLRVNAGANFNSERLELLRRPGGEILRESGDDSLVAFDQDHAGAG